MAKLPSTPADREKVTLTAMIPGNVIPTTASSSSGGPPSGFLSGLAPGFLNKTPKKNKKMREYWEYLNREEADRD